MKKRLLSGVLVAALAVTSLSLPNTADAETTKQKLQREIRELEARHKKAQEEAKEAKAEIKEIQGTKKQLNDEIAKLDQKIAGLEADMNELQGQIDETTAELNRTIEELAAAEERVAKRDEVLKVRLRSMYEGGQVSYFDLLLGSSSFGEFLTQFDSLKTIVDQDNEILVENKKDRDLIAEHKVTIEADLEKLDGLFAQVEQMKVSAEKEEANKRVRVAKLESEENRLHEIEEEEEAAMIALAADAAKKRDQIRAIERAEAAKKGKTVKKFEYAGGVFAWPVPDSTRITSQFGYRSDPFTGRKTGHSGMDIAAPTGTTIVAVADGEVILAGYQNGFGNTVIIDHGSGIWSLYGHIKNGGIKVKVGQAVSKGDKIAEVGSTGRSTGPHLHLTVYKNQVAVDPRDYLKK